MNKWVEKFSYTHTIGFMPLLKINCMFYWQTCIFKTINDKIGAATQWQTVEAWGQAFSPVSFIAVSLEYTE